MIRLLIALIAVFCLTFSSDDNVSNAQVPARWEATKPPVLDFSNLVIGKVGTENGESVVMLIKPIWQSEQSTRVVNLTKYRTETKTRIVQSGDNGTTEEAYTVSVPYTEQVEQTYFVLVPVGKEKVTISLDSARAWGVQGKLLSPEELSRLLAKPTHLMLMPSPEPPAISPYYEAVLSQDLIFLYSTEAPVGAGSPSRPDAPINAPPAPPTPIVDPSA